jgi:hypothetical protein
MFLNDKMHLFFGVHSFHVFLDEFALVGADNEYVFSLIQAGECVKLLQGVIQHRFASQVK